MKTSIFTFLLVWLSLGLQAQIVNIPDANFKAALLANAFINTNSDSEIQLSEAQNAQSFIFANRGISDLTGIEEFINLKVIGFPNNNVTTADLTGLDKLQIISVDNNQLTSLILPTNVSSLNILYARNNQLTSLIIPPALDTIEELLLSYNQLTTLDLSGVNRMLNVYVDHNQLTSFGLPPTADYVHCEHNQLTTVGTLQAAIRFNCGNNQLDSLTVTGNVARVECDSNQLQYLNVGNSIDTIFCQNNQLDSLIFLQSSSVHYINCSDNLIRNIIVFYSELRYLDASNNRLDRLTVNNNDLMVDNNFPLDASGNPALECIATNRSIANATNNWTLDAQTTIANDCASIWFSTTTLPDLPNTALFPNPSTGAVQVDLGQVCATIELTLYNSLGQEVYRTYEQQQEQLTLSLPAVKGLYHIRVTTELGQATFSAIKE